MGAADAIGLMGLHQGWESLHHTSRQLNKIDKHSEKTFTSLFSLIVQYGCMHWAACVDCFSNDKRFSLTAQSIPAFKSVLVSRMPAQPRHNSAGRRYEACELIFSGLVLGFGMVSVSPWPLLPAQPSCPSRQPQFPCTPLTHYNGSPGSDLWQSEANNPCTVTGENGQISSLFIRDL